MTDEDALLLEIEMLSQFKNMYLCIDCMASELGRQSVKEYLEKNNIKNIVIYGAGVIGRLAYDTICCISDANVIGIVDKSGTTSYGFHEFISLEDLKQIEYDLIVITPLRAYSIIAEVLKKNKINNYCFISELLDSKGKQQIYENDLFS